MRIAMISPLFESVPPKFYGGTERVIYNLARGLLEAGIDVTTFASGDSTVPGELVPVTEQAFRLSRQPIADPVAYNFRLMSLVAKHAHEFDVIHNHHDYWMLPLSEMTSTPLLSTLHGRLDLPDIPAAFMSFPNCSYVSISDAQRGPLGLLDWVRTIHHGMDLNEFPFSPNPGKYLAFLGRISWEKAPHWAIEIAKLSGVPLKIAAKIEGPESEDYWRNYIKPHVDGKFIEFVGEIAEHEKAEFLGSALGLVFPIDWPEPFGLVVTEALACGTPVLARPMGSMTELLKDGVTGYCHSDIRELARRVHELPNLSREACRNWVAERFSLKRMTEDYIDVYRQLSQNTRRAGAGARDRRAPDYRRNLIHSI